MCMKQNSLILIFFKETTEILDLVFKKLTGVYYQV